MSAESKGDGSRVDDQPSPEHPKIEIKAAEPKPYLQTFTRVAPDVQLNVGDLTGAVAYLKNGQHNFFGEGKQVNLSDAQIGQIETLIHIVRTALRSYDGQKMSDANLQILQAHKDNYLNAVNLLKKIQDNKVQIWEPARLAEILGMLYRFAFDLNNQRQKDRKEPQASAIVDTEVAAAYTLASKDPLFGQFVRRIHIKNNVWREVSQPIWMANVVYPSDSQGFPIIEISAAWNRDQEYLNSPSFHERMAIFTRALGVSELTKEQAGQLLFFHELGHSIHGLLIRNQQDSLKRNSIQGQPYSEGVWKAVQPPNIDELMELLSTDVPENNSRLAAVFGNLSGSISYEESARLRMRELARIGRVKLTDEDISSMNLAQLHEIYKKASPEATDLSLLSDKEKQEYFKWKYTMPTEVFADKFAVAMMKRYKLIA